MINLVRNELCKLLHKKAIYVYLVIADLLLFLTSFAIKSFDEAVDYELSADIIEESLDTFDLSNPSELSYYIGDRVLVDQYRLLAKYGDETPEGYYIYETIVPLIHSKYEAEYSTKDKELAKEIQKDIDRQIKLLDNFDWKKIVKDERKALLEQIKVVEEVYNKNKKDETLKLELDTLNIHLWCLDYRLENNVPYTNKVDSNMIDQYEDYAVQYLSMVKDEKLLNSKEKIIQKREVESNYYTLLHKLENKDINENQELIDYVIESFKYVDGFIVIGIIIICGSIISEEFNKGTIKQLLIKPFSRSKILTSKIIASLIVILLFLFVYETAFLLVNCYEYSDFTSIFGNTVVYDYTSNSVREVSVLGTCLYGFVSMLPAYLIIFGVVILVGVLSTSSVATICSGFGVFIGGDLITMWLTPKIVSYLPFFCWDLSSYMFGGLNPNKYASFGKSIVVDIITLVGLFVVSYILFNKKEIKNQ